MINGVIGVEANFYSAEPGKCSEYFFARKVADTRPGGVGPGQAAALKGKRKLEEELR